MADVTVGIRTLNAVVGNYLLPLIRCLLLVPTHLPIMLIALPPVLFATMSTIPKELPSVGPKQVVPFPMDQEQTRRASFPSYSSLPRDLTVSEV
jgi:hypothetical protein